MSYSKVFGRKYSQTLSPLKAFKWWSSIRRSLLPLNQGSWNTFIYFPSPKTHLYPLFSCSFASQRPVHIKLEFVPLQACRILQPSKYRALYIRVTKESGLLIKFHTCLPSNAILNPCRLRNPSPPLFNGTHNLSHDCHLNPLLLLPPDCHQYPFMIFSISSHRDFRIKKQVIQ